MLQRSLRISSWKFLKSSINVTTTYLFLLLLFFFQSFGGMYSLPVHILPLYSFYISFTLSCDFNHKLLSFLCYIFLLLYFYCYCTFTILCENMSITKGETLWKRESYSPCILKLILYFRTQLLLLFSSVISCGTSFIASWVWLIEATMQTTVVLWTTLPVPQCRPQLSGLLCSDPFSDFLSSAE